MTGFGKATLQLPTKKITVEIKSLNSKGLDLNTRMPSVFREMELGLRNQISARLERGKIDFSLYIEATGEETSSKINVPIVRGYINQMKAVIPNADETELMKMAVRMPDALKTERDEIDENEWKKIQTVIDEALENIAQFRKDEGVSLEREFLHRIANIMTLMNNAVSYDADRVETVKTRLRSALDELKENVDENRFEQDRAAMKAGNFTGIQGIPNQDMAMWVSMGPIVDRTHDRLGASDLAIVEFRQRMLQAVRSFMAGETPIGTGDMRIPVQVCAYQSIIPKTTDWRQFDAQPV